MSATSFLTEWEALSILRRANRDAGVLTSEIHHTDKLASKLVLRSCLDYFNKREQWAAAAMRQYLKNIRDGLDAKAEAKVIIAYQAMQAEYDRNLWLAGTLAAIRRKRDQKGL